MAESIRARKRRKSQFYSTSDYSYGVSECTTESILSVLYSILENIGLCGYTRRRKPYIPQIVRVSKRCETIRREREV
jgi:hypothetical protein